MQVSGCFTCTITGHRMGAGGNEISSCAAGASKVCAPSPFCTAWGIEFRHERAREPRRERRSGETPEKAAERARGNEVEDEETGGRERDRESERRPSPAGWAGVTLLLPIMARLCACMSRGLIEKLIYEKKRPSAIGRPSAVASGRCTGPRSISAGRLTPSRRSQKFRRGTCRYY